MARLNTKKFQRITLDIPKDIHYKIKVYSAFENTTLKEIIMRGICAYLPVLEKELIEKKKELVIKNIDILK